MEFVTIIIYLSVYMGLISTSFYVLSFIAGEKKKKLMYEDSELPKVSVIIPAYNEEDTIGKTIGSILKSHYPDFEVLVVDDGSKDQTLKVAKEFEGRAGKVSVFHKKNGGKGTGGSCHGRYHCIAPPDRCSPRTGNGWADVRSPCGRSVL